MYVSKNWIFLCMLLLLQLVPLLGYNGLIVCVAFLFLYSIIHIKRIIFLKYPSKHLINLVIIVALINIVYCKIVYNQGILDGLVGIYFIGLFFAYYFFYHYFIQHYERIDKVNDYILFIAACISIVSVMQSVFFPYINVFAFSMRNGRMRIPGTAMSFFAEIIGIAYILCGKVNFKRKFAVLCLIFSLFFVSQSRGGIILLFLAVAVTLIKRLLDSRTRKSFLLLLLLIISLIIGVIAISKTVYWNQIFSFIDEIQEGTGSGATRVNEMLYYFHQIKGKELMGLGLLRGGSFLADKIFRTDIHYYIEDLGLLGFILQTGVAGAVWVIWTIISLIKKLSQLRKIGKEDAHFISVILLMLLVVTLIGFTNANYIVARSTILFFSMLLAEADVLIVREYYIE